MILIKLVCNSFTTNKNAFFYKNKNNKNMNNPEVNPEVVPIIATNASVVVKTADDWKISCSDCCRDCGVC